MVFDDGLVYDSSVKNKTLQDISLFMKLPKSYLYFGYSDENGVLYFIHSDGGNEKFITKFHKSFNNKGHITVPKSKRSNALLKEIKTEGKPFHYRHGVLMGNLFWTFGGKERNNSFFIITQTTIWSTNKQVWIKGPELITLDDNSGPFNSMATWMDGSITSVINSTTIIMIGLHTVVCVNIKTNRWTDYPDFPYPGVFRATTVSTNKNGNRCAFKEEISTA